MGSIARHLIPVAADLGVLAVSFWLLPWLTRFFERRGAAAGVLVVLSYLLFCLCVLVIRRREGDSEAGEEPRQLLGGLAIFFGLMVLYMVADVGGLLELLHQGRGHQVEGVAGLWVVAGALAGFALVFLYPVLVWVDVRPDPGFLAGWGRLPELLSLLGINLMILVTAAHWELTFAGTEPYQDLALGGKILIFAAVYLFFLLFYAPPRMLFLLRRPSLWGVVSFGVLTAAYVWRLVSGSAW